MHSPKQTQGGTTPPTTPVDGAEGSEGPGPPADTATNPYGERPYRPRPVQNDRIFDTFQKNRTALSFPDRRIKENTYQVLDPQTANKRQPDRYTTLRQGWLPEELRGWRHPDQTVTHQRHTNQKRLPDERPTDSSASDTSPGPPPKRARILPRARRGPCARVRSPSKKCRRTLHGMDPSPSSTDGVTWSRDPSSGRSKEPTPSSSPGPPTPHWVQEAQYDYKSQSPPSTSDSGS